MKAILCISVWVSPPPLIWLSTLSVCLFERSECLVDAKRPGFLPFSRLSTFTNFCYQSKMKRKKSGCSTSTWTSFEQTRMAVCWDPEDATKRRTWRFAAYSVASFDFVSLNHFFPSSFLTGAATVVRSLSQQICQAWVMMPTDEMRISVIWSRRRHLSLRFPLPFIIAEVAGRNVRLCWRNHPVMQRREERAVYLRRQIYKCLWSQCLNVSS